MNSSLGMAKTLRHNAAAPTEIVFSKVQNRFSTFHLHYLSFVEYRNTSLNDWRDNSYFSLKFRRAKLMTQNPQEFLIV